MFRVVAIYTASASTFFYIIYCIIGRQLERKLVKKNEEERLHIEKKLRIEKIAETFLPGIPAEVDAITTL